MNYYIGVDGGGTSTKSMIIDQNGHEVAQGVAGPGSYRAVGLEHAVINILVSIDTALQTTKINIKDIKGIFCGLASIDTKHDHKTVSDPIEKELHIRGYGCPIQIVNDAVIAMRAATNQKNAILVIMGTGANCYGKNQKGLEVWVSGLDYILSDEAGGYAMGLKALRSAVRSADGRDPKTLLEQLVKKELEISEMREAKDLIYTDHFQKKDIAAFSSLVFRAHEKGDLTATKIMHETVDEAILMIHAAHKRLALNETPFDLVMVGGLTHEKNMQSLINSQVRREYPQANIIFPMQKSSRGAALMAMETSK